MRHPIRATISAVLAMLALTWTGPAGGGIAVGLTLGWIIAATWPDRHERVLTRRTTEEHLLHYD